MNIQYSLENKEENFKCHTTSLENTQHGYNYPMSLVLAEIQAYSTIEYSRDQRRRHRHLELSALTMVPRIHTGENTLSSINGVWKID
jgi:hypothetical protein